MSKKQMGIDSDLYICCNLTILPLIDIKKKPTKLMNRTATGFHYNVPPKSFKRRF